jgi:hypothetical protein
MQARVAIFMDINSPFLAFAMNIASESHVQGCRHELRYSWISSSLHIYMLRQKSCDIHGYHHPCIYTCFDRRVAIFMDIIILAYLHASTEEL